MKTLNLLSGVAATVLLGTGITFAQAPQAPEKAPAAQQQAPAEKMAPSMKAGEKKGPETTGQASPSTKSQSPGMKAEDAKPSTTGQAPSGADKSKSSSEMNKSDMKSDKSASDPKMDSKSAADSDKSNASKGAASTTDSKSKDSAQGAASTTQSTTGQGAAAGAAKLSTEQQTKITATLKSQKVESVPKSQINVSISVGTKVPSSVRLYPVPAEVVTVYPEWRGYYFILVDGQYIIIEPRTHEIVYIIV